MTKLAVPALAFLATLLAPLAAAHGAAPPREVDRRVLLDQDGALGYGGCSDGTCLPGGGLDAGAPDLLALDLRELRDANGTALLAFRTTAQSETAQQPGRAIAISFSLNGHAKTITLQGDGLAYASQDVDRAFVSKDAIGDGHAKAVEAWVSLARLGARPGDTLTDIRLASFAGTTKGDIVPGTWFPATEQDQPVPYVPGSAPTGPSDLDAGAPGNYTLSGPAPLLGLGVDPPTLDASHAPAKLTVTLHNPLRELPQFVTLHASGPGLTIDGDAFQASLEAGTTKTLAFTVSGPAATLNLTAVSDLGGYATLLVPVSNGPTPSALSTPSAPAGPASHGTSPPSVPGRAASGTAPAPSPSPASPASRKSPALPPALPLAGLAFLAAARRRGTVRGRDKNPFSPGLCAPATR